MNYVLPTEQPLLYLLHNTFLEGFTERTNFSVSWDDHMLLKFSDFRHQVVVDFDLQKNFTDRAAPFKSKSNIHYQPEAFIFSLLNHVNICHVWLTHCSTNHWLKNKTTSALLIWINQQEMDQLNTVSIFSIISTKQHRPFQGTNNSFCHLSVIISLAFWAQVITKLAKTVSGEAAAI